MNLFKRLAFLLFILLVSTNYSFSQLWKDNPNNGGYINQIMPTDSTKSVLIAPESTNGYPKFVLKGIAGDASYMGNPIYAGKASEFYFYPDPVDMSEYFRIDFIENSPGGTYLLRGINNYTGSSYYEAFKFGQNGSLTLGVVSQTNSQYMLNVNGLSSFSNSVKINCINIPSGFSLAVGNGIITEKVKVATYANWPDYVFSDNYRLKSLEEVEDFIKKNNHLPNVPSANQVAEEGLELATMNAKLLEKVEELTLYIIEQNKKIKALEQKFNEISQ